MSLTKLTHCATELKTSTMPKQLKDLTRYILRFHLHSKIFRKIQFKCCQYTHTHKWSMFVVMDILTTGVIITIVFINHNAPLPHKFIWLYIVNL